MKKGAVVADVEILDIADKGKCIAKKDDFVIFVKGVVPGDNVDIKIFKKKKAWAEGSPVKWNVRSPYRAEPFCDHFGLCGGCKWQDLDYERQLVFKQKVVMDNLQRIGKLDLPEPMPIIGSEKQRYYRNKLEFTFTDSRWLTNDEISSGLDFDRRACGFHIPMGFDKIIDVQECFLQDPFTNDLRNFTRDKAKSLNIPFYNLRHHKGQLRNLILRSSTLGEWMYILQFAGEKTPKIEQLLEAVSSQFPQLTSVQYIINNKGNETFNDLDVHLYKGQDFIQEQLGDIVFRITAKSFFQTNSRQAKVLYDIVVKHANIKDDDLVYDLYTGTGTIANYVARAAKEVIGVEYVKEAIDDALVNAQENNITNTKFYAGDMKDVLNEMFITTHGRPDVLITDPPRAGMHADVVHTILKAAPERIVYVSCNPATQARDLEMLAEDYAITVVQPVDMFPHTHHVENVVVLERRG